MNAYQLLDAFESMLREIEELRAEVNQLKTRPAAGFFTPSTLTIATDQITVSGRNKFRNHLIDTEAGAATDSLVKVNGGENGDLLILQIVSASRTVTVTDNGLGGNLRLAGNFVLNGTDDQILLKSDGTDWQEISRSDNS